ncbi:MAG: LysR family transcriptional regulator [Pseudomonadales bacterium]|nr:LysR family transcriptional regulator [Pseudomonadales bacterium]MDG2035418.1 LysR family transcriptional regulator [Pseudomonadales bacterium]
MKFTLRQLQVFLATAHYQNISRAADSLAMSQSAASGALRDLEQRYDAQLFDRVGKRLQLNAHGNAIRPLAESLMAEATEVEAALEQREATGNLNVGATLTIGNYIAIPIIARFKQDYPAVDIRLHVANTEHIAAEVLNFDLDIGLIEGEYSHPDLSVEPWHADELVVFCAPDHPYAQLEQLSDQQLIAAQWILREQGSGTRQTFDRAMQGLLNELDVHLELEHTEAIKRAVEAGLGLGCLSGITLSDAFKRGTLVPLAVAHRDMHRQFYFVTHKKKFQSRSLQCWLDCCRAAG